jgi:hypothetical protein
LNGSKQCRGVATHIAAIDCWSMGPSSPMATGGPGQQKQRTNFLRSSPMVRAPFNRVRVTVAGDPPHTTVHAGRHTAVQRSGAS